MSVTNRSYYTRIGTFLLIALGILLSVIQVLSDRGIWLDEAVVCLNLIQRNFINLLKPLDYNGVAPIGFLEIQKCFSILMPKSDIALRIVPFLCYASSLILFSKLLKLIFKNFYVIVLCICSLMFNQTIIYYSGEAKQYMGDLFIAVTIFYLLLKFQFKVQSLFISLSLIGCLGIWISNTTPIILLTINLYLLCELGWKEALICKKFWSMNLLWVTSFAIYYSLFISNHPTKVKMQSYWATAGTFMPFDGTSLSWLAGRLHGVFYYLFYFGWFISSALVILYCIGLYKLILAKNFKILILSVCPILIHIILSGLHQYPFETRLYLYIAPMVVIICGFGHEFVVERITVWLPSKLKVVSLISCLILPTLMLRVLTIHQFPFTQHDDSIRCINYINSKSKPEDALYVGNLVSLPVKYYQQLKLIANGLYIIYENPDLPLTQESVINIEKLSRLKQRLWILTYPNEPNKKKYIYAFLRDRKFVKTGSYISQGGVIVSLFVRRQ